MKMKKLISKLMIILSSLSMILIGFSIAIAIYDTGSASYMINMYNNEGIKITGGTNYEQTRVSEMLTYFNDDALKGITQIEIMPQHPKGYSGLYETGSIIFNTGKITLYNVRGFNDYQLKHILYHELRHHYDWTHNWAIGEENQDPLIHFIEQNPKIWK